MTVRVNVTKATVALEDTGKGAPVLLLHGFPATRLLWSRVAALLTDTGFRVLVPDLIGYGASEAAAGVSVDMAGQARWMLEVLDVLGVARTIVVAHDVGSAAAQLMVVSSPQRVRGLAVLDGVFGTEWRMNAIDSIRSWDPTEAGRIFPVLARRLGKSAALRDVLAAYEGRRAADPRRTRP
jgi:pimeloyl-ACP methyl ester carboxylesterase